MDKKGFFFTVVVLVLLSFLLLSVTMWSRTIEAKEQRMPEKYGAEAMTVVLDELSDAKISEFANMSAKYALYRLDNFTYSWGPDYDFRLNYSDGDEPYFVAEVDKSMYDLMTGGKTSNDNWDTKELKYGDENKSYTLAGWEDALKAACEERGLNISFGDVEDFKFNQTGTWNVTVYFTMDVNVSDNEGNMELKRKLTANATFPIDGFVDPMIAYESTQRNSSIGDRDPSERQIFRNSSYTVPYDASPVLLRDQYSKDEQVAEGKGWFFGNITTDPCIWNDTDVKAKLYVLVHDYFNESDGRDCGTGVNLTLADVADYFGGVIVTNLPKDNITIDNHRSDCTYYIHKQYKCLDCLTWTDAEPVVQPQPKGKSDCVGTDKTIIPGTEVNVPFVAVDGDNWRIGEINKWKDVNNDTHVLFDNEKETVLEDGYHRIWNIEPLRDLVLCGYYVETGNAPSFLQRFTRDGPKLEGEEYGIETFVEGRWAGGEDDRNHENCSRVDHVFYNSSYSPYTTCDGEQKGIRIKGMPGCKSKEMCTFGQASDSLYFDAPLGRFVMDNASIEDYTSDGKTHNVTLITCDPSIGSACDVK